MSLTPQELATRLWSIADLLRGDLRPSDYPGVIMSLTVLRRLDCLHRAKVSASGDLRSAAPSVFTTAQENPQDPAHPSPLHERLLDFVHGFSEEVVEIITGFGLTHLSRSLEGSTALQQVIDAFAKLDLSPLTISDHEMGATFEELVRITHAHHGIASSEHSTPADVAALVASLLIDGDPSPPRFTRPVHVYDPACGAGGLLSAVERQIPDTPGSPEVRLSGQDINREAWAMARALMLMKGDDATTIRYGDTLSDDRFTGESFDYMAANPPFGLYWKQIQEEVRVEAEAGPAGRFEAGLPRPSDSLLLFVQHMVSHMRVPEEGGSRMAIVLNASPMTTGGPRSGESNIRKWLLDNNLLEGAVALPRGLFQHTAIPTYLWIMSNRPGRGRQGRSLLLDARRHSATVRVAQGAKRRYFTDQQTADITELYRAALSSGESRTGVGELTSNWVPHSSFAYQQFVVETDSEIDQDPASEESSDRVQRFTEELPIDVSATKYLKEKIKPQFPSARIKPPGVSIGYRFSPSLFLESSPEEDFFSPEEGFGALSRVASILSPRAVTENDLETSFRLRSIPWSLRKAEELPRVSSTDRPLTPCTGGDVVGSGTSWRLLPKDFGDALTNLTVLRPHRTGTGDTLAEWLRSQDYDEAIRGRLHRNTRVPVDIIQDLELGTQLGHVNDGRISLEEATTDLLPGLFRSSRYDLESLRSTARLAAAKARLVTGLISPFEDPVWRAEWGYPYPIATLARKVRVNDDSAERKKDALLKLAESVARSLGVISLRILVSRRGTFSKTLREGFHKGAGFGSWIKLLEALVAGNSGEVPELPVMSTLAVRGGALELLNELVEHRNTSGHAHDVRAAHALDAEVRELEPLVVSLLEATSWLSELRWDWVKECQYTGSGHELVGQSLLGAHPDWEPFQRPTNAPLAPDRVYVRHHSVGEPLDLWPFVTVQPCEECPELELFLLNEVGREKQSDGRRALTLRSGRDHQVTGPVTFP